MKQNAIGISIAMLRGYSLAEIDSEFQRELDGIVKGLNDSGVKVDRWDIVALNALEELPYYYLPGWTRNRAGCRQRTPPATAARSFATGSYTKDHRIVMGHNAWTSYIVGERWNIIFDISRSEAIAS